MPSYIPKEYKCVVCGNMKLMTRPRSTCSDECLSKWRTEHNRRHNSKRAGLKRHPDKPLLQCPICKVGTYKAPLKTCSSKDCRLAWRSEVTTKKMEGQIWGASWCMYSPPNEHDMKYMLDILKRKGYIEGQDPRKEKYTYSITEAGDIEFFDLPPSPTSHDWQAYLGKKLPPDSLGVEQESEEASAYSSTLRELQTWFKDFVASAQEAVGESRSDWIH